jgi:predicted O-methyltransferase YrrM
LEAAVSKTLVITNDLAGLNTTVGDRGVVIPGDATTENWKKNALYALFSVLQNNEKMDELIEKNYNWGIQYSWKNQADKMLNYMLNEKLQYKGEFSLKYLNDPGFYEIIQYYNESYFKLKKDEEYKNNRPIHILEIGTYTGLSLIHMTKCIPNSIGFGIDKWTNYEDLGDKEENRHAYYWKKCIEESKVKDSFYENIKKEGCRIKGIQGDSNTILTTFMKQLPHKFDLIYVDGNKDQMIHYMDLFLSWQILNPGGFMFFKKPYVYGYYHENSALNHFANNCFINNKKQYDKNNIKETDSLIFFRKE